MKFREELEDGEQVFSVRASLIFKEVQVVRFFDETRNALVYLTYSDRVIEGSPKNSISAVVIRDWQSRILYRARGPVTLVGGGPVAPGRARRGAGAGARGGRRPTAAATSPLPDGHAFRAVIGDMDSLRGAERARAPPGWRSTRSPSRTRPTSRNASTRSRRRSSSASASSAGGSTTTSRR